MILPQNPAWEVARSLLETQALEPYRFHSACLHFHRMQPHEEECVGLVAEPGALQPMWDLMLGQRDVLTSPLTPGLSALLIHLALCAPFLLLDALACVCPRVRSYQISESTSETRALQRCSARGTAGARPSRGSS